MKTVPDFLTREEADAILAVPNKRYPTGHRNYYLMRFLLGSGLRCSEALAVKVTDLDLANRRVKVRNGKRRRGEKKPRQRTVAISRALTDAMALYLATRSFSSEYLFSTAAGGPLQDSYLRHMLARYGSKAGISHRVHPHLLRHTYGTWLYDEGVPLSTIQSQLGHDRLETTAVYAHASGKRQAEDVARLEF
ncbi:MAG: tyrosine-type recombinase/integrase [Thermoleophilia bacterium]